MGFQTTAQSYASLVIGQYNVISGDPLFWQSSDPVFVVGNGANASWPSNALTLTKEGSLTIAGSFTQNSDKRLKEDIHPLDSDTLEKLNQIQPIYYNWKNKKTYGESRQIGVIAQEIEVVFPELVMKDSKGYLSVDYSRLSVVLLEAIKEQQVQFQFQIQELKAEIAAIKASK